MCVIVYPDHIISIQLNRL